MSKLRTAQQRAELFNTLGNRHRNRNDCLGAQAAYEAAISSMPNWASPWFNLGLLHKYAGDWVRSLEANQRAAELDTGDEGAIWNIGIAATALQNWSVARQAWQRYGIAIAEGEGPVDHFIGLTPIRVNAQNPEVLWSDRIDPARAIIRNVPSAASGRRYGDLLLHDGAANGYRRLGEREVPVFDELALITASKHSTFEVLVKDATVEELEALMERFDQAGGAAENWTTSFRILCRACSEGRPDDAGGHDHAADDDEAGLSRIGIALESQDHAEALVQEWLPTTATASASALQCLLHA